MNEYLMALGYVFPAYVANATPIIFVRLIGRPHPLDMHAYFLDGRRVLGDGKTREGLFSGIVAGSLVGLLMHQLLPFLFRSPIEVVLLSAGAMLGDIAGAFLKRRIGLEQGQAAPLLDQLGFLAGSLAVIAIAMGLPRWLEAYLLGYLAVLTFLLHMGTNAAAYALGLKDRWY